MQGEGKCFSRMEIFIIKFVIKDEVSSFVWLQPMEFEVAGRWFRLAGSLDWHCRPVRRRQSLAPSQISTIAGLCQHHPTLNITPIMECMQIEKSTPYMSTFIIDQWFEVFVFKFLFLFLDFGRVRRFILVWKVL